MTLFALGNGRANADSPAHEVDADADESRPAALRTSAGFIPAPAAIEASAHVAGFGHPGSPTVGAPFVKHSITSREAARQIAAHMPELRHRVWLEIEMAGANGLTDEEVSERTGLGGNTVRPRRGELERDGFVVDSGRTRATASGRRAVVWITIENAPEHARFPGGAAPVLSPHASEVSLPDGRATEPETAGNFSAQQAIFDLLGLE